MTSKRSIASSVLLGMALAVPSVVSGHHAWSTEFAIDKEITITGVITKVQYTNPHTGMFVNVTEKDGTVSEWELNMAPPANLFRAGWRKEQVPIGATVTVVANPAKDGVHRLSPRSVTLPNGDRLPMGGGQGPEPARPAAPAAPAAKY